MKRPRWVADAIEFLKHECIEHVHFNRVVAELSQALQVSLPGEIVVFVGPSRVGKSRAAKEALAQIYPPPWATGKKPYVIITAENEASNGFFSTKAFMQNAHERIGHPFYGVRAADDPWGMRLDRLRHTTSEPTLRNAFENALQILNTQIVGIDEAHHVRYVAGGDPAAARVLDSYKCLAQKTNTVVLLIGSYELMRLVPLAPHLLGRQDVIEFPRYRLEIAADVEAYWFVLEVLGKAIGRGADELLTKHAFYIFNSTLGCVGLLCRWLRSALGRTQSRGGDALELQDLELTQLTSLQLGQLSEQIEQGEPLVARRVSTPDPQPASPSEKPSSVPGRKRKGPKGPNGPKPFKRTKIRMPVGRKS